MCEPLLVPTHDAPAPCCCLFSLRLTSATDTVTGRSDDGPPRGPNTAEPSSAFSGGIRGSSSAPGAQPRRLPVLRAAAAGNKRGASPRSSPGFRLLSAASLAEFRRYVRLAGGKKKKDAFMSYLFGCSTSHPPPPFPLLHTHHPPLPPQRSTITVPTEPHRSTTFPLFLEAGPR